ncbi:MAG: hypothetical protein UZ16_OP3001002605 [Candidatus Hinthialibacteria bacterium OLB16]|nr:MAG: hypothetical protein UZ16_OP3001002605 [Candidatus Hinthialibacteria bacterium OLB16]
MIDIRELKRIIRLVESSGIEELEIEQEGVRVRVRKGSGVTQTILADRFLPPPAGYPGRFPKILCSLCRSTGCCQHRP